MSTVCCWVIGCGWTASHDSPVTLELRAEQHRRAFHAWVKEGRCHWTIIEPEAA